MRLARSASSSSLRGCAVALEKPEDTAREIRHAATRGDYLSISHCLLNVQKRVITVRPTPRQFRSGSS